jgi:hypothetical protein
MEKQIVTVVNANEVAAPVAQKQNAFSALFSAADVTAAVADAVKQAPAAPVESPKAKQARAVKSASKPAAKPFKTEIKFVVRGDGARKLFAHTAAWMELTGLIEGKSAPVELIRALGGSALSYHTKQGNMEQSQGMVKLTVKGLNHFKARYDGSQGQNFSNEDKEHYMLMMMEGLHDDRLIKDKSAIIPADKYLA